MRLIRRVKWVLTLLIIMCMAVTFISCNNAEDNAEDPAGNSIEGNNSGVDNAVDNSGVDNIEGNNAEADNSENIEAADNNASSDITAAAQNIDNNTDTNTESDNETNTGTDTATKSEDVQGTAAYFDTYQDTGALPSLAEVYKDIFRIGVALSKNDFIIPTKAKLVAYQFNSITCENEMKPDFTLDRRATLASGDEECPVVNMSSADTALTFAKENGMQMRGHTLVWHSQTPRWLFTVGYDNASDAPFVTREVMLVRMENYIRQVMEYVNTTYPGVVYAWDVVNEAIEPADGQADGIRIKNNLWYEVVGEDYIEMAFTYARKYAAPEQKLFYNDYNTYEKNKLFKIITLAEKLKEKGIIDGIGMQDHIQLSYPSIIDYQYAINKYAELGLEIQVTELDIDTPDQTEETQEKLASRYKNIMVILQACMEKNNANITSITFWGLTDDRSWLNRAGKASYPLLFNFKLEPKRAFFGVLGDASVKLY